MNEIVARIVGVDGDFPHRATDWVIVNEAPEGTSGASGQTVGVREANQVLGGLPQRAEYFERLLAAKQRACGYPVRRDPA
ncbi:MAG: hypothetical protein KGJ32_12885 [Xanthomonadaceae bacterium]|nr:hypothetical protein [Xanthomonadaceae bacterium]